jgi:hypothetical protein
MRKQKRDIFFSIGFLSLFALLIVVGIHRRNSLDNSHNLGVAIPYSYSANGRGNAGSLNIDYSYKLNDKEYKATLAITTFELSAYDCNNYFIGTSFPVVYSPSNPSNSILLIRPKDFKRFGVPFPDSLRWVLKYIHEP